MSGVGAVDHRFCLSLATLLMAGQLADVEPDEQRRRRKRTVVREKWSVLRDTFPDDLGDLHGYGGTGPAIRQLTQLFARRTADWAPDRGQLLLIDLVMSNPFAPYRLRVGRNDFGMSLVHIASTLELSDEGIDLLDARREVLRAHRDWAWMTVIDPSVMTASALTTSGPDPAVAAVLASAAGFDGEAATAHGIALLGGGSLAVGGSQFAGGLWLATAIHGDADMPLTGGGQGLLALGLAQARVELVKLQLSARFGIHRGLDAGIGTDDLVDALAHIAQELTARLDEERGVNDADAPRITRIEVMRHAVDTARRDVGGVEVQDGSTGQWWRSMAARSSRNLTSAAIISSPSSSARSL